MSLKAGEVAWRITGGKYQGRLCWTTHNDIDRAIEDKTKVTVQLLNPASESNAYYGLWGDKWIKVKPKHLNKVTTVVKWSDQV